jgi:hypothetical protein
MIYEQDKKGMGYVPRGMVLAVHVLITIISFKESIENQYLQCPLPQ